MIIDLRHLLTFQRMAKPSIYMLLSFKIQAHLHKKDGNEPSEVIVAVDGVKDLHHKHSHVRADIYDYHSLV